MLNGGLGGSPNVALQNTGGGAITLTLNNASGVTSTYNGILSGTTPLTKSGAGTEVFGGANTYTGNTTVEQGTLELNFNSGVAPASNILVSTGTLFMGGVPYATTADLTPGQTFNATSASGAAAANPQSFAATVFSPGDSTISTTQTSSGNMLLNLGALTHNPGGTVNFNQAGTTSRSNAITTTNLNDASGILGGWATVTTGGTNGGMMAL